MLMALEEMKVIQKENACFMTKRCGVTENIIHVEIELLT